MSLVEFTISPESIQKFADTFKLQRKANMRIALAAIKRDWQAEFVRQDINQQKKWIPLKTWVDGKTASKNLNGGIDPRSYAAKKARAYYGGKSRKGPVRYLRILKRTGVMLERYISGIAIDEGSLNVEIQFPDGEVGVRAKTHFGLLRLPKGVLGIRQYDINRFKDLANQEIKRTLINT